MDVQTPLVLLALLLVPLGVARYVAGERRRRAAARSFASDPLLASVAPVRPGWRRHVPLALYALALAVLIVAVARPRTTVAVPVEDAAIVLATDVSGSMQATDVRPSRLAAAREAVRAFADEVPADVRLGVLAFNQNPRTLQTPTRDRDAFAAALDQLRPSGTTATGDALAVALATLRRQRGEDGRRVPGAVVLLTDGVSRRGRDAVEVAREARRLNVPVNTVALGTAQGTITVRRPDGSTSVEPVPPDPAGLREIARASGGQAFTAEDADELGTVYDRLGSQLGTKDEKREVTSRFVGGALALLAAGAGLALVWFGRLP